ncbi:MAG: aspartyl protease family protein [Opitutaceae bacterium]|nr:aspartyl protease family protein [Opitutaceae bacterium]
MTSALAQLTRSPPGRRRRQARIEICWLLLGLLWLCLATGCVTIRPDQAPSTARLESSQTIVPARLLSNFFIVETKWHGEGPYRLLIDTGSSATLVSADLARRFKVKDKKPPKTVPVHSANGGVAMLESVTLRKLWIGNATFEQVPARVYDFQDLSSHLGLKIDGAIGFPVFRDTLLTLDYPGSRLILTPRILPATRTGATISFNNNQSVPLIPVQMGNESFIVLIDTGSDGSLSLNPVGLHPKFAHGPRPGPLVATLAGDRVQMVGRLGQSLLIGPYTVDQPIADLTDELSSIGGELLKHFVLTFDQKRNQVTFSPPVDDPIRMEPRRSTGLSFSRTPAYWRVLNVVPGTPTSQVQTGDLCVRINGETVEQWPWERYAELVKTAKSITYTFLAGTREYDLEIPTFDLVP